MSSSANQIHRQPSCVPGVSFSAPSMQTPEAPTSSGWREDLKKQSTTLRSIRHTLLNQTVVIGGPLVTDGQTLLSWSLASLAGNVYKATEAHSNLPYTYRGRTAKVVAVQLNESKAKLDVLLRGPAQRTNALGEAVLDEDKLDPYFDLVVQFDDGILALTSTFPTMLVDRDEVELASIQTEITGQMSKELPGLIGQIAGNALSGIRTCSSRTRH